jgi:hypothetical protein
MAVVTPLGPEIDEDGRLGGLRLLEGLRIVASPGDAASAGGRAAAGSQGDRFVSKDQQAEKQRGREAVGEGSPMGARTGDEERHERG